MGFARRVLKREVVFRGVGTSPVQVCWQGEWEAL